MCERAYGGSMRNKYSNVVIEVSLDEGCLENLLSLKRSPIFKNAEQVSLVSVYNDSMVNLLPCNIVNKEDFDEIKSVLESRLSELRDELIPSDVDPARWHVEVILSKDVKHCAIEFLRNRKADLAITSTRGHQGITGIFKDSFAFYLVQHAPCDVYVIRPVH
jgi:nucleotide-binding universal stress UspA family protein